MYVDPYQNSFYRYCPCCGRPLTCGPQPWQPKQYPDVWCSTNLDKKDDIK